MTQYLKPHALAAYPSGVVIEATPDNSPVKPAKKKKKRLQKNEGLADSDDDGLDLESLLKDNGEEEESGEISDEEDEEEEVIDQHMYEFGKVAKICETFSEKVKASFSDRSYSVDFSGFVCRELRGAN